MKDRVVYIIAKCLLYPVALLPWKVLYLLSDVLAIILYYAIRYRRNVVLDNLSKCFPDKTPRDRIKICKRFYRNFADCFVETVKLLHVSDEEIKRRMEFANLGIVDSLLASGKDIAVYFSHCGNWEWAPSVTLHIKSHGVDFCQVYRPLANKPVNKLMLDVRSRFGSLSFPKKTVLRDLIKIRRTGLQSVTGFMSDQKPSHGDPTVKTLFLNRPTAFISGTETLIRKLGMASIYWDIERKSRGHYLITCRLLDDGSNKSGFGEITLEYSRMLEHTILRDPAVWLWTHKRWKYPVTLDD